MIAFGCSITDAGRPTSAAPSRASAWPPSRTPRSSPTPRPARSSAATTCSSTRPPARDDLEALVLVHQDAEIVDPDFCAKLREALAGPGRRRRGLRRRDRRAQHRVVGGLGDLGVVHPPLRRARRRRAAGVLVERRGAAAVRAHRRGRHRRRLRARRSRPGWSATSASTSRSASCTATTSTSACRCARPASKVVTADFQVVHHHSLDLVSDPETWIEAHMRVAEKWDGRMPGIGAGRRRLEAARPARGGRGGRGARAARSRRSSRPTRASVSSSASSRSCTESIGWRLTGAAPPAQRAAPAAAAEPLLVGPSVERAADVVLRDRRRCRPGARSRERRSATANALGSSSRRSTASWLRSAPPVHDGLDHLEVRRGEVEDPVRLEPLKHRVAVPGLEQLGRAAPAHGARLVPDHPEAEERRHDREPHARALRDEVLDGGQHAVARRRPPSPPPR